MLDRLWSLYSGRSALLLPVPVTLKEICQAYQHVTHDPACLPCSLGIQCRSHSATCLCALHTNLDFHLQHLAASGTTVKLHKVQSRVACGYKARCLSSKHMRARTNTQLVCCQPPCVFTSSAPGAPKIQCGVTCSLPCIHHVYEMLQVASARRLSQGTLSIWEALDRLSAVREPGCSDAPMPDLAQQALQTAEACRLAHPQQDWLHLVALIHELGKLLAHPRYTYVFYSHLTSISCRPCVKHLSLFADVNASCCIKLLLEIDVSPAVVITFGQFATHQHSGWFLYILQHLYRLHMQATHWYCSIHPLSDISCMLQLWVTAGLDNLFRELPCWVCLSPQHHLFSVLQCQSRPPAPAVQQPNWNVSSRLRFVGSPHVLDSVRVLAPNPCSE